MNDRIKELLVKSGLLLNVGDFRVSQLDPNVIKFAELIVKECVRLAYDAQSKRESAGDTIQAYFGDR